MLSHLPPSLVAAGLLVLALPALAADQAGVSAAVRGQVALARAQVANRQVVGGEEILMQDAIQSGPRSGMQVMLLDETVFTIGPDSELTIDEFVYDPKTDAGKVSAKLTKGVFRFVTGKIAHKNPTDMEVELPSGTLGVRGTIVGVIADPVTQSSTVVLLGEGLNNDQGAPASALTVCNASQCVDVNRPEFATTIGGPGTPPTPPFHMPLDQIQKITGAVSDPTGYVETASSGSGTDVAAGPESDEDPRSAGEISGEDTAKGSQYEGQVNKRLNLTDNLDTATTEVSQFTNNAVLVDGRPVEIPLGCASFSECFPTGQIPDFAVSGDVTTYNQLASLASEGTQSAIYQRNDIPLSDGGSYNFLLSIDLGRQQAFMSVSDLDSPSLGVVEHSFRSDSDDLSFRDFASQGLGGLPVAFGIEEDFSTSSDGPCDSGCTAVATAVLQNGHGRVADSAAHIVGIIPQSPSSNLPPVYTDPSQLVIPRGSDSGTSP